MRRALMPQTRLTERNPPKNRVDAAARYAEFYAAAFDAATPRATIPPSSLTAHRVARFCSVV